MDVSIIIPVRETKWLTECIESLKATCSFEVIVESDKEGKGAAQTRNKALKRASGKYVIFCDSDDYMEPGAIDLMLSEIGESDFLCGSFRKFGDFEQVVSHPTWILTPKDVARFVMGNLKEPRRNQMLSGCWAKLYRRELIDKFPELVTAEDMAFNFDYLRRCKRIKFLDKVVYHNRKRQGSLSTSFDLEKKENLFGLLDGLKYVRRFLQEQKIGDEEIEDALDSSKVYHSMLYFLRMAGCGQGTFKRLYP